MSERAKDGRWNSQTLTHTWHASRLKCYPVILCCCWFGATINRFQNAVQPDNPIFALFVIQVSTRSLQGVLNAIAYGFTSPVLNEWGKWWADENNWCRTHLCCCFYCFCSDSNSESEGIDSEDERFNDIERNAISSSDSDDINSYSNRSDITKPLIVTDRGSRDLPFVDLVSRACQYRFPVYLGKVGVQFFPVCFLEEPALPLCHRSCRQPKVRSPFYQSVVHQLG